MAYDAIVHSFTGHAAQATLCPHCFLEFAIPSSLADAFFRDRTKRKIWCPSCGETMIPNGKSEADRVRDDLAREQHKREQAEADARHQRNMRAIAAKSASAYKGQATRVKNRVRAGVCPFCNRSFENVARHMASKHQGVDCAKHDA